MKYKALLKIVGQTYVAEGKTAKEAIGNLEVSNIKGGGVLTIEHEGMKKDKILTRPFLFRLFHQHGFIKEKFIDEIAKYYDFS